MKKVTIYMDDDMYGIIQKEAKADGLRVSQRIRVILTRHFRNKSND